MRRPTTVSVSTPPLCNLLTSGFTHPPGKPPRLHVCHDVPSSCGPVQSCDPSRAYRRTGFLLVIRRDGWVFGSRPPQVSDGTLSSGLESRTDMRGNPPTPDKSLRCGVSSWSSCPRRDKSPVWGSSNRIAKAGRFRFRRGVSRATVFCPMAAMKTCPLVATVLPTGHETAHQALGCVQSQVGGDGSGSRLGWKAGVVAACR